VNWSGVKALTFRFWSAIRVGTAFNLEGNHLVGNRIGPIERNASQDGSFVFLSRALRAIVARISAFRD
jgi:hypothetical protein